MLKRTLLAVAALALLLGVPAAADQITGGRPAEYTVSVKTLGAKGDAQSFGAASGTSPGNAGNAATMTAGSAVLAATTATTFTPADIGKAITVDGAGAAAGPLSTTIAGYTDAQHVTLAANATTATPAFQLASCPVTTDQSGSGSYAPNDTVTLTGGSGTQAVCKVQATQVHGATVNAAGSGGTTGACILTGTTGTSASGLGFFQVNATIAAGAVSAIGSFVTQGIYTVNPTSIAAEPVTSNCGVTGVTLTLVMGIKYAYPSTPGLYTTLPATFVQGSTSGSGAGATFSPTTNATGSVDYGTDDSAAFATAIAQVNALATAGTPAVVQVPPGNYLLRSTPLPTFSGPGGIVGYGQLKSVLVLDAGYAGDLFSWTETWNNQFAFNGTKPTLSPHKVGPQIIGLGVVGDRSAPAQQNAFVFYDRNDNVLMQDVSVFFVPGAAILSGVLKNTTQGFMRESNFTRVRVQNAGLANVAAVEFDSVGGGDGTNVIKMKDIDIYGSASTSMWIHADSSSNSRLYTIEGLRIEGLENGAAGNTGDLLELGDTTGSGNLNNVHLNDVLLIDPYLGGAALHVQQPSGPVGQTYGITFQGVVVGATASGKGLWLSGGRNSSYTFNLIGTNDYNVQIDSTTFVGTGNQIADTGQIAFTSRVDATSTQNQSVWLVPLGTGAIRGSINGNARGANAFDGQSCAANTAAQVAGGQAAVIVGGCNNTANGLESVVTGGLNNSVAAGGVTGTIGGGQSNTLSGSTGTIPGGFRATDRGLYSSFGWASGFFAVGGDAQTFDYLLRGTTSNTTAVTLTGDGLSAGSANCVDVPTLTGYLISVDVYAFDHTTPGNNESWQGYAGKIHRPGNAASTVVVMGTKPTALTSGTVTGSDISIIADTTNGCLNISFTPPTGNSDTWRAVAKVRTIQVQ